MRRELVPHSKFLSLVLRHDPAVVGVVLDESGWTDFPELLAALQRKRPEITRELLIEIVETNEKRRFALSEDMTKIRASQGHSVGIDLGLPPTLPPPQLYHGTAERNLASIRANGLLRGQRDHVHLSPDEVTALTVGSRHGKPVVLGIQTGRMAQSGFIFYRSENGVWLTAHVPAEFIVFPESPAS